MTNDVWLTVSVGDTYCGLQLQQSPTYIHISVKCAFFFEKKYGFLLYCLNTSCIVICRECMNFLRLTFNVNVSLNRLKQSSQFIIHFSTFRLNIRVTQLVVDVEDNVV